MLCVIVLYSNALQVAKFRALSMMWSSTGLSREGIERDSVTTTMGPEPSQSSREQEVASVECQTSSGSQHSEASCSAARPGPQNCSSSDLESVCEGPFLAALLTKLERLLDQVLQDACYFHCLYQQLSS